MCEEEQILTGAQIMQDFSSLDEDYGLIVLLGLTRRMVEKLRQEELSRYGLRHRQASVLFYTQLLGGEVTYRDLARWMFRDYHTISAIVNRMEKDGLVRKIKHRDEKKNIRIVLTTKGQEAYQQAMKRESIHQMMSYLSKEERQQLRSSLEKLQNAVLKALGMNYKPPFP